MIQNSKQILISLDSISRISDLDDPIPYLMEYLNEHKSLLIEMERIQNENNSLLSDCSLLSIKDQEILSLSHRTKEFDRKLIELNGEKEEYINKYQTLFHVDIKIY